MGKKELLFITILYFLSLSNAQDDIQYQNAPCLFCPPRRKKITTSGPFISFSYSPWREEGTYNNLGNDKNATFSYIIPAKIRRTSSFAADITISSKITDQLNGKPPQYEISENLKGSQNIPPKKIGFAMYREKTETATFKHQIQFQENISKRWKNKGPATYKYTRVTTITPEIKVEIRDR